MRARIDVSEIEAQTKIRAKYLRALENEEWSLLPGPTFVKSFLRTYAQALGLDGKALVEEFRLNHERVGDQFEPIVAPAGRRQRQQRSGPSRGYVAAVSAIGVIIVVLIVALATGGGGGGKHHSSTSPGSSKKTTARHSSTTAHATPPQIVALSLKATGEVYVCLLDEHGHKLVPGSTLQTGESTATFHSRHFDLTLGNSSVVMYVDGRARTVKPSSAAIGYSITHARGRQPLTAGSLPKCE